MNELIFFIHVFLVIIFLLIAFRLGKNYLIALIALQAVIANLFVIKQIELFGQVVTATDVFIVGTFLSENLLQEYFGRKEAIKAIKVSFLTMTFFLVMTKMHLLYSPSLYDFSQNSFQNIFSHSPRIILASMGVFFLVQRLDIYVFSFLKKLFQGKSLTIRIGISAIFSQLLDTVLFSFLGLYGIVENILDIILVSFLIKIMVILLIVPFLNLLRLKAKNS